MKVKRELTKLENDIVPSHMVQFLKLPKEEQEAILNNKQQCSCGNELVDIAIRCTKCYLKNDDWKYRWVSPHTRLGWWLLIDRETDAYLRQPSNASIWVSLRMHTWETLRRVFYRDQGKKCIDCDGKFSLKEMELHHILPRVKGGLDVISNLKLLCEACHKGYLKAVRQ